MPIPEWTKPAIMGAGAGAVVLAIVGFNWGGWMTSSSATELSEMKSTAAVAAILTPYCVQSAKSDPKGAEIIEELKKASSYKRRGIVEKAGWATPLGTDKPDRDVAQACQLELTKDT